MSKSKPKPQTQTQSTKVTIETEKEINNSIQLSENLLFNKSNYQWMAIGLIVIFIGFMLMLGKNNVIENAPYPAEDLYSFRRIVLSSIVVISGFLIEVYAILVNKK